MGIAVRRLLSADISTTSYVLYVHVSPSRWWGGIIPWSILAFKAVSVWWYHHTYIRIVILPKDWWDLPIEIKKQKSYGTIENREPKKWGFSRQGFPLRLSTESSHEHDLQEGNWFQEEEKEEQCSTIIDLLSQNTHRATNLRYCTISIYLVSPPKTCQGEQPTIIYLHHNKSLKRSTPNF